MEWITTTVTSTLGYTYTMLSSQLNNGAYVAVGYTASAGEVIVSTLLFILVVELFWLRPRKIGN